MGLRSEYRLVSSLGLWLQAGSLLTLFLVKTGLHNREFTHCHNFFEEKLDKVVFPSQVFVFLEARGEGREGIKIAELFFVEGRKESTVLLMHSDVLIT